jgi:hypothetical protein
MDWQIDIYYLVFLGFCIHFAWILGKRQGISSTLSHLAEKGLLELDED